MTPVDLSPSLAAHGPGARKRGRAFALLGVGPSLHRLSAALAARRVRRDLHALSDHILEDIGIPRDKIDYLLKGAFRRL